MKVEGITFNWTSSQKDNRAGTYKRYLMYPRWMVEMIV